MRLDEYIAARGDRECAELFGVKERTAASWRRKERTPRPEMARQIVERTAGEVSLESIYGCPETQ